MQRERERAVNICKQYVLSTLPFTTENSKCKMLELEVFARLSDPTVPSD